MNDKPSGISDTVKMINSLKLIINETVAQEGAIQGQYRLVTAKAKREHDES